MCRAVSGWATIIPLKVSVPVFRDKYHFAVHNILQERVNNESGRKVLKSSYIIYFFSHVFSSLKIGSISLFENSFKFVSILSSHQHYFRLPLKKNA
jgi:hypothetical protein